MNHHNNAALLKILGFIAVAFLAPFSSLAEESNRKPNVLFIAVDDLRPQLGCYGETRIQSPNIDRLAGQGLLFERAYCQQAICMASRASMLSGYRPETGQIYRNGPLFSHIPDALTLNQHFINNGYEAVAMGKIYHHASDYDQGWSQDPFKPDGDWKGRGYLGKAAARQIKEHAEANPKLEGRGIGPAFEARDAPDNAYPDGVVADYAIKELNRLKDQSFFLAVGFIKPHLPFNAPQKYWDLYPEEDIQLASNPFLPQGVPPEALTEWGELRAYYGMPEEGPIPDELARKLIHGYYACVSYIDAQIGRLLDELDRLKLRENTIIVLWGDHGWKLGDHGMWCKHTNFELDTRVPLILSAPGMASRGKHSEALVELVDIYPTLCELCDLELPNHLEGTSMVPLLANPDKSWKKAAFSLYAKKETMGYSLRTDRYRYIEWRDPEDGSVQARELYDHQKDPEENINVAGSPKNQELVATLAEMLNDGYKAAKP